MQCESPIRIRNKYTGQFMYVACNKCDVCRANKAVARAAALHDYISTYDYVVFVTLTYDDLHLPFIVNAGSCIYRFQPVFFDILQVLEEPTYFSNSIRFMVKDAVGVLYYRDVQLFFKRLRKNLNSVYGYNFRYFVLGEYGSDPNKTRRPHYHICFLFRHQISFELFRAAVIKSWCLCDWSKLDLQKCFEVGNAGCSYYLSAYVAGYVGNYGIFQRKEFKPFCARSKDINFGLMQESGAEVQRFVFRGDNKAISAVGKRYFEVTNTRDINLSTRVISAKFLYTYFSKPAGLHGLSRGTMCGRVREVLRTFITRKKVIHDTEFLQYTILNHFDLIGNFNDIRGFYIELSSSDYLCYLSYRRFCDFFKLNPFAYGTIDYYSLVFDDVHRYYNSLMLRAYMLRYEKIGKFQYLIGAYNTDVEDMDTKLLRFVMRTGVSVSTAQEYYDKVHDTMDNAVILQVKQKYSKFLLPKHLNEYGK